MASNRTSSSHRQLHIAAIPWPGRGHINPMLNLSRSLLANDKIIITFIVTEEWFAILSSSSSSTPLPPNLRLLSIPNVLPSESTRGADLMGFIHSVFTEMGAQVEELLLQRVDPVVDTIIADTILPWVPSIASKMRVPLSSLFTMSPTMFLAFHLYGHCLQSFDEETNEFLEYLPRMSKTPVDSSTFSIENIHQKFKEVISLSEKAQNLIFTSIYELENHAIDTLKSKLQIPIYCLGNAIPSILDHSTSIHHEWLDSKPRNSVMYVSLGSYLSTSSAQMDEMVHGLNASGVLFFLVTKEEEFKRFEELCGDSGFVVPWCNQLDVLCHASVGGFLTHCGWNSTLEGLYAGVPMLTFPLVWDQLPNSKLIIDKWKVGLRLKVEGKENDIVGREEIARIACEFMDLKGDQSKELRRRAAEIRDKCRKALGNTGSCSSDLDALFMMLC
ncbi:hypothetical protein J5N97_013458 [Dioscorea zingiberensis]|uniref:Glycosyltransferase n=1 Tax=Dioscorea zingiberensis TaxID=325984 RepID=A0A9D5CS90_9LILI|nr:hypothetical protein J5N97_013458 [Dioscorea zingiberensis]